MQHIIARIGVLVTAAVLVLTGAASAQADTSVARPETHKPAYFEFRDSHGDTFVFKLTDAAKIKEARNMLANGESRSVMGVIIKRSAPYNPPWSYHLDPKTVEFFDQATEVCDASIQYVEDHLDEVGGAFLPGNRWCPWSSELVREV
ncbi:calmodulin-binding protein [Nocardiopsis gilva YIM 90087]|uniref:Calmodulin-binding protein n=1 Tax=Nocardiopsis gilva YIM 90087 TaxID=1235441 RepID=A0A223S6U6_9ACTN|nr:hypothetical protein [Nocardiopsis gilva]ASU83850.1 calmodulin-binding protein [Nocardiopsis gilva YIM 90087]